jgi:monothiol glutaredoxin
MDEQLKQKISELVASDKVFLFMKGTPEEPQCGFSMQVSQTLKKNNINFKSFNVFDDEGIREGIKAYANWPTIPQLYIDGKFIGGCDITLEMANSGDLQKLL